jgi:membrane fusion protein (multidrug efflux system)
MLFLASLLPILSGGCSDTKKEYIEESSVTIVSTQVATEKSYSPLLSLSGTVFANREANLGAGFPGRIEKIYFSEGKNVSKGDVLVEMSGEMLAQAEAEYLTIKKDFERVSRLVQNGSVSNQEYDHVKARFEASTAKYELARKNTQIRAPFSGVIVDYLAHEGENYFMNFNIEPGYSKTSGILRLMQLDPVKVKVEINEKDLCNVSEGLVADISVDALPGEVFSGKITLIKPYLSIRSRAATAEITIPNKDMRLKPGMFARVSLELPYNDAVFISMEALYRDPETDKDMVFVVEDNVVRAVEVEKIFVKEDIVSVTNINAGDTVVVGGKARVKDGVVVEIVNEEGE